MNEVDFKAVADRSKREATCAAYFMVVVLLVVCINYAWG